MCETVQAHSAPGLRSAISPLYRLAGDVGARKGRRHPCPEKGRVWMTFCSSWRKGSAIAKWLGWREFISVCPYFPPGKFGQAEDGPLALPSTRHFSSPTSSITASSHHRWLFPCEIWLGLCFASAPTSLVFYSRHNQHGPSKPPSVSLQLRPVLISRMASVRLHKVLRATHHWPSRIGLHSGRPINVQPLAVAVS